MLFRSYGYNVYWQVLNAKHYGIPQNRERVYCVIIRKDLDNGQFKFPEPLPLKKSLPDMLETNVDERYYLSDDKVAQLIAPPRFAQSLTQLEAADGDQQTDTPGTWLQSGVKLSKKGSQFDGLSDTAMTLLARDYKGFGNQQMTGVIVKMNNVIFSTPPVSYCIDANYYKGTTIEQYLEKKRRQLVMEANDTQLEDMSITKRPAYRVRKLTQKECWRLMGFDDLDYERARDRMNEKLYDGKDRSGSQLYKQAGNSIVVDVLQHIMEELYKAMPYLFEDIEVGSFFSGIGAFEKALQRLNNATPDSTATIAPAQNLELEQLGYINGYNGDANRIYNGNTRSEEHTSELQSPS